MSNVTIVPPMKERWKVLSSSFKQWLHAREYLLSTGLNPEPSIKMLIFLALLETNKPSSYDEIMKVIESHHVVEGTIPNSTLRTSVLNLGKTLDKLQHHLELKSFRGYFQLVERVKKPLRQMTSNENRDPVVLLLDPPAYEAKRIACDLIEKSMLPFQALYFLEWSARWWEIYSSNEAEIRVQYESGAWEKLGIKDRLFKNNESNLLGIIGFSPCEGLTEIELLKKILHENKTITIHYLAIDSSKRLLRNHINLLKETLTAEIECGRLVCAGIISDIFDGLKESVNRVRNEFFLRDNIKADHGFLPAHGPLLVTYFGNCLGNNYQDQETEIFSIIHSSFDNRPLEFLVGVSVMRSTPDEYKRNWDDFLLQTPKHLLETKKILSSSRPDKDQDLPEFNLPKSGDHDRCPPVIPESYIVRHKIEGQIYRFYYKLSYHLKLASAVNKELRPLPAGTLILLYNIIKYNMQTLVRGVEKCGLFKIQYDENYHQIVDTQNGKREYAVFTAYLEK